MKRWPVKVTRSCCGALEFRSDDLPVRGTGKAPRAVMPTICAANAVYSTTCSRKTPGICRCRNTGCVEAYAGGWAMARDLRAAGKDVQTVNDVVQCLKSGDSTAQQLLRRAGRILGLAVADAVSLFNPSVVSVCGQLAGTDEQLLAGIREVVYTTLTAASHPQPANCPQPTRLPRRTSRPIGTPIRRDLLPRTYRRTHQQLSADGPTDSI